MSIVFYYAPISSASPVASALAELDVAHERVTFDLSQTEHKQAAFLSVNPNGKVPALVVDGTPMFEALAILLYLGERFGVERGLWPAADNPARLQAYSWCTWAYVSYGSTVVRRQFASGSRVDPSLHHAGQAELALRDLDVLLGILNTRLTEHQYLLGETFSLVDLVVASVVSYSTWFGAPVERHPRVHAWLEDFRSRDSFRTVMGSGAS